MEHLRFGLDLLLHLLELAATRKHPRLDEVLLRCAPRAARLRNLRGALTAHRGRDEAPRRHLFELAHHTCLLVCEAAGMQPVPPASARLLATLPASAARLLCFAAGGTATAWPALAAALAALPDGKCTHALLDATSSALQAMPAAVADPAGGAAAGAAAEAALEWALQLVLERLDSSCVTRVRPPMVSLLTAPPPSVGGAPAGLRAALRLCTAALAADCSTALGARCAARGVTLLMALCYCRTASFLDDVFADAELMAMASPLFAMVCDLLRLRLLRPLHAPPPADATAHPEPVVADAALQTATLRICALMADDKTTRAATLEALSPALGAALAMEPAAFASRWCGGDEAAARFPTWVATSVRAVVGGTSGEALRKGWCGGPNEQSMLLFCLLATIICTPPARELPGASGVALAMHAAAAVDGGARNAAANVAALLRHVSGNANAVPQDLVQSSDVAYVSQLGNACVAYGQST